LQREFIKGRNTPASTIQTFIMKDGTPTIGFWGTSTDNLITGLGIVAANSTCVPDGNLPTTTEVSSGLSTGGIVGIIFGCLFGVTCIGALSFVGAKMGCKNCKKPEEQDRA